MADHIQIGDIAPRVHYVTNGMQGAFTYPFPIFEIEDLEVRLDNVREFSGFSVQGAGSSNGGQVVFDAPPAPGRRLTLRRNLRLARTSDFQSNGVLRARVLNDELDYQVAAMQEQQDALTGAMRLDPSEYGDLTLPSAPGRANKVLGFDATGGIALLAQTGLVTNAFTGAVPRSVEDKLAEALTARDFGAVGDGVADDGPALQAAMNAATVAGKLLIIGEGTHRTTMPLSLSGDAAGLTMRGSILYAGTWGQAALTIGSGGAARNATRRYTGLRVLRATQSDWSSESDVGIRLVNLDACHVEILQAEGFCIGIQTLGDERGFEDSTLHLGRIANNRYGLDIRTGTASGWNNSITYIGGHFANASSVNPTLPRFGVRFSCAAGAYDRHNAHNFVGPAFELQRQGTPGTVDAIPFLVDVADARAITARGIRMEQCSPYVARHTGGANDCLYEVGYVGTYGFTGAAIHYPSGATRAGGTVVALHQAAAAHGSPRLVAEAGNVRARAFRWNSTDIGFEGMTVLSGNPSGPPTTMNGLCFPGLSSIGLNNDTITLPTSRGIGFVVDCALCREFFLAAEGTTLRPFIVQFDGSETVLTNTAPVLFSNMNAVWQGSPSFWWEGNADLDSLSAGIALNRLQRVTLHGSAAYAVIGVRGGQSSAVLKALRLYVGGTDAPAVLSGGGRLWGGREITASMAYDPPSIAAGASATQALTVPNVQGGDFVSASHSAASAFIEWTAAITTTGAAGTVTARATNRHASTAIDLASGTLLVRAIKPKL
jgi:hypothetical protein